MNLGTKHGSGYPTTSTIEPSLGVFDNAPQEALAASAASHSASSTGTVAHEPYNPNQLKNESRLFSLEQARGAQDARMRDIESRLAQGLSRLEERLDDIAAGQKTVAEQSEAWSKQVSCLTGERGTGLPQPLTSPFCAVDRRVTVQSQRSTPNPW